jgi:natural resistance-associated macrophage protein 2
MLNIETDVVLSPHSVSTSLLQAVTWTVATLLITINGYLLMDLFSKEIRGPLSGSLLCLVVLIYALFVLYLILRGTELSEKVVKAVGKSFSWQG